MPSNHLKTIKPIYTVIYIYKLYKLKTFKSDNIYRFRRFQIDHLTLPPSSLNPSIVFIYIMFLSQWCILIWMDFRANLLELRPVLVTKLTLAGINQKNINGLGTCDPYILRTQHVILENK